MEKEIHNEELECTDGVVNTFFQVFDLLEEELKNLEKIWALKAANIIHFLGKFENWSWLQPAVDTRLAQ